MRRRPKDSQPEPQDMEPATGASSGNYPQGSASASGTGMQDTGTTYQQQGGTYQQGGYQQGGYQQGGYQQQGGQMQTTTGDDRSSAYYGRPKASRHGAALAMLAGSLAFLEGLAFIIRSHYYHTLPGYAYRWNLHGWGWVLLILGALLFAAGMSHFLRIKGSEHVAAALAVITAVVSFITLFYSVVWGIIVVAACGFAAHSLLSHRSEERYGAGGGSAGYGGAGGQSYYEGQRGAGQQPVTSEGGSHRRL